MPKTAAPILSNHKNTTWMLEKEQAEDSHSLASGYLKSHKTLISVPGTTLHFE